MALTVGTKLGPYEIRSQLGAGGMGEVYRAVDTRLDRTVAVKVLASHLSSLPDGKTLYYLDAFQKLTAVDVEVAGDSLRMGPPRTLFQTGIRHSIPTDGYDVSRDGRFLVLNSITESAAPIVLVTNWDIELKK